MALGAMMAVSCADSPLETLPDYTLSGHPVRLKVSVLIPQMNAETRGDLSENQLNRVESLWIRTYNAQTLMATSKWIKLNPATTDVHNMRHVDIDTESGYTYIIAVANVNCMGVTSDDITRERPLGELLEEADTWDQFLKIAVLTPSDQDNVNAPQTNSLPMCGCYSDAITEGPNAEHIAYNQWQKADFQPYFIPASSEKVEFKGGIHLRRLVSHITFNFTTENPAMELVVNSYRVMNVPKYSWLYERSEEYTTLVNFGDKAASAEDAANFYEDVPQYGSQFIRHSTSEGKELQSFDFWQAENKHTGTSTSYADRGKKKEKDGVTLFTSLTGDTWTPDNEASYVVVDCDINYKTKITVDDNGAIVDNGTEVDRSGNATYFIHLGNILGEKAKDFNCFRNVDYTYNVTVNGLDDIRVDAVVKPETYHNEEGLVVDLDANPISLDAHYAVFNIYLSEDDLKENFGFIITTYDNGEQITLSEKNPRDDIGGNIVIYADEEKKRPIASKYYNWIELRPTTRENVLAEYKPRFGEYSDGKTFLLTDLFNKKDAAGNNILNLSAECKSASGYYTVFVNEYTYEPMYGEEGYGDESNTTVNGNPAWMSYVNQNPRRFYIKVSYRESADGNSVYARSKYAVQQQSLMTYFSQINVDPDGTAVAVERENETFGLNLRHFDNCGGSSLTNGRWNAAQYLTSGAIDHHDVKEDYDGKWGSISVGRPNVADRSAWAYFLMPSEPLEVPGVTDWKRLQGGPPIMDRTVNNGNPHKLRKIKNPEQFQHPITVPAPNFTDPQTDKKYNIIAMSAFINRNRDNNGNGKIDAEELRWYIPAMTRYVGMTLGENAMPQRLMMFDEIQKLPYVAENEREYSETSGKINNCFYNRYMYIASNYAPFDGTNTDNNVLWALEGTSLSKWQQVTKWSTGNDNIPVNPWQIRCVRNLGSDLRTVKKEDKVTMPFRHDPGSRILNMKYFNLAAIRTKQYSGNGEGNSNFMPIHTINSSYNSVYKGLEYAQYDLDYSKPAGDPNEQNFPTYNKAIYDYINTNPCGDEFGNGWRLPNQIELTMLCLSGALKTANTGWLSSTVQYINSDTGEGNDQTQNKLFMVSSSSHTLLLTLNNYKDNAIKNLRVRCVRDVNP